MKEIQTFGKVTNFIYTPYML